MYIKRYKKYILIYKVYTKIYTFNGRCAIPTIGILLIFLKQVVIQCSKEFEIGWREAKVLSNRFF